MFIAALFIIARTWKQPRCGALKSPLCKFCRHQNSSFLHCFLLSPAPSRRDKAKNNVYRPVFFFFFPCHLFLFKLFLTWKLLVHEDPFMAKYTVKISSNSCAERGGRSGLSWADNLDNLCDSLLSSYFLNNYIKLYFRIIHPYT